MKNKDTVYVLYPFVANFGGIERLIVDLARYLDNRGKSLVLLAFQNLVNFADYGAPNLRVETISCQRSLRAEASVLKAYVREQGITSRSILAMEMRGAIYAGMAFEHGYSIHIADPPGLLPSDLAKYSFSLAGNYPELQNERTFVKRCRGQVVHWLTKRGVRKAGGVATMTQRNVEELQTAYGLRFEKIPPGVRVPETISKKSSPRSQIQFLSVCRLEPSKRIDAIIQCFARVVAEDESGVHFSLQIVGQGSQAESLKQLTREHQVEALVKFSGLVSDDELETAYSESDVFVMPARQGYGLPGLESLVRGLQLVVHRDSGVTEFLADMPQVQIVDNFDSSLTVAMKNASINAADSSEELPTVPTSDGWAEKICDLSGWS